MKNSDKPAKEGNTKIHTCTFRIFYPL